MQLPSTKAAVKAMDTIETFIANETNPTGHVATIDKWIVMGASKRGAFTWLTAAVVPHRVEAFIVMVYDLLNQIKSWHKMYRSYGGWADFISPMVEEGCIAHKDTPLAEQLMSFIDPYSYRDRLTMPKYIVNAADDPCFMNDNTHLWWDDMPGPKHFLLLPNT